MTVWQKIAALFAPTPPAAEAVEHVQMVTVVARMECGIMAASPQEAQRMMTTALSHMTRQVPGVRLDVERWHIVDGTTGEAVVA